MKLMIVSDAWGNDEAAQQTSLVGASGRLLKQMLREVGINESDCFFTSVFNLQPQPTNDIKNLCGIKAYGIPGRPPLFAGKYVLAQYAVELHRLRRDVERLKPNLILGLGPVAAWALDIAGGITRIRGTLIKRPLGKIIITYHPSGLFRDWSLKPIIHADLNKAKAEMEFPELRRPVRTFWIEPTLEDLARFEHEYIIPNERLSIDIETQGNYITCVGFAPTTKIALIVPFIRVNGTPYWPAVEDELHAWNWVKRICALPKRVLGQNFLFDMHRLWRTYGITVPGATDDTMLLHHALFPELQKGLGFLGSIYTNEGSWKKMRHKDSMKKEDE